ncbi:MAG: FkbM family methyltransferase [Halobaculum sp.]
MKRRADRLGLDPYLGPFYRTLVKRPYWWFRCELVTVPTTRQFGDVSAQFVVEEPADLLYHETDSERAVMEDLLRTVNPDDVFYDIGANVGLFTCAVGQVVDTTAAFEPSPVAFQKLTTNVSLNDLDAHTVQVALAAQRESVELAVDRDDSQSRETTLLTGSKPEVDTELQTVKTQRLDEFVSAADLPVPNVVKLDVEGAELRALKGMGDLLDEVRVVYCEIHNRELAAAGADRDDVLKLLSDRGLDPVELKRLPGETEYVKASR